MLVFDDVEDRVKFLSSEQAEFYGFLLHVLGFLLIRFTPGSADRTTIDPFQFEEGVASRRTEAACSLNLALRNDDGLQFPGLFPVMGFQCLVKGNNQLGKGVCVSRDTPFEADVACRLQQSYGPDMQAKSGFTWVAA